MSNNINYKRRQFLQYSAVGTAFAAFSGALSANIEKISSYPNPDFKPDVEIEFTARKAFIPIKQSGPYTRVQKYYAKLLKGPDNTLQPLKGNYLGPTLNLVKGQKVRVFFKNKLNEPSIIHWHGLHVPQASDGHPMYSIAPGEQYVYEFEVKNRAGTSFYHSHTHELTAEQVHMGLAGLITVTDEEEQALNLPAGEYDLPLVIQDRTFNDRNQLQYIHRMHDRMLGFLGDTILVNGKPDAEFSVKTRAYRFRALNGSNSRIYKLGWDDGTPLTAIGTDASLLEHPETRPYIMLAPGERVDLWLDFSNRQVGSKLVMYSLPYSGVMPPMYERMKQGHQQDEMKMEGMEHEGGMPMEGGRRRGMGMGMGMMGMHKGGGMRGGKMGSGMMGMMPGNLPQGVKFPIATFKVTEAVSDSPALPNKLASYQRLTEKDVDNADNPIPIGVSMKPMAPQLNGKSFAMDKVVDFEKVALGSIKKIRIFHDHGPMKGEHGEAGKGEMKMEGMDHEGSMQKDASEKSGMQMGGMRGGGMGMMGGGMNFGMMMGMAHPIHLHGQQYQVLSRKRTGMETEGYETVKDGFIDSGWKDTVLVMPGEEIQIIKPFQDYKGLFLYHCHNLEHEDLGMMRQFYIQ
ncbi:MAG: multicopper oxidase family protein [Gammaproteobacteria bacterium]